MKYEKAKKEYILAMERVAARAARLFFNLAMSQVNVKISEVNFSNADTLFRISKGRFQIGKISENDLLQMELSFLNAELAVYQAQVDFESNKSKLRSFLGFNNNLNKRRL